MIGGQSSGQIKCGQCGRVGLPVVQYAEVRPPDWHMIARQAVIAHHALQEPIELAGLLAYLHGQIRPLRVLEIGGAHGGSAWAWLQLPTVGQVVTVDLPDPVLGNTCRPVDAAHTVIQQDSTAPGTVQLVESVLGDESADLVFIDGAHDYGSVIQDWHNYAPLCSARGVIAFHDILPWADHPEMEVHRLWADIRASREVFELIAAPQSRYGIGIVVAG